MHFRQKAWVCQEISANIFFIMFKETALNGYTVYILLLYLILSIGKYGEIYAQSMLNCCYGHIPMVYKNGSETSSFTHLSA